MADIPNNENSIEIINNGVLPLKATHFLFDFDGTISTLRRGWESVMKQVMCEAVEKADVRAGPEEIEGQICNYIEGSTGIQTILQMQWLSDYIRKNGGSEPLKPIEYKDIYNKALNQHIKERKDDAKKGRRHTYLIPGSEEFLKSLTRQGKEIVCISGTDRADVTQEAAILGLSDYFTGGIYGSLNDVDKYSKRIVIQDLISKKNVDPKNIAIFGDGPVEIRAASDHGSPAIGVCCNEKTLQGRDEDKYTRLKQAGADVIITNFTGVQNILLK